MDYFDLLQDVTDLQVTSARNQWRRGKRFSSILTTAGLLSSPYTAAVMTIRHRISSHILGEDVSEECWQMGMELARAVAESGHGHFDLTTPEGVQAVYDRWNAETDARREKAEEDEALAKEHEADQEFAERFAEEPASSWDDAGPWVKLTVVKLTDSEAKAAGFDYADDDGVGQNYW